MDPAILPTSLGAVIDAGKRQTTLHQVEGFKPIVASTNDNGMASVALTPEKLARPRFLTAAPKFHEANAFIEYVNAFKDRSTRLFYTQEGVVVAVFDYHQPALPVPEGTSPVPMVPVEQRHGDHQAILVLKRSPEWETWKGNSEKAMGQESFAEFLEDNAKDILQPGPDEMMEVAIGLHATSGAIFRRAINQSNGQVQVQYDENIEAKVAGGTKEVPTTFQVGLRPFMGCDRFPVDCRLRYRVQSGSLAFHYKALHLDWITEAALSGDIGIVAKIRDETQITPALGAHDAQAFAKGQ